VAPVIGLDAGPTPGGIMDPIAGAMAAATAGIVVRAAPVIRWDAGLIRAGITGHIDTDNFPLCGVSCDRGIRQPGLCN
jgi:hypothetical protein